MKDCLFCKIINGEIPSYKIYEDEYTYAFLDISNDANGHILVIPKNHCTNILDAEEKDLGYVMKAIKKISNHLVENCGFSGVNILNANGEDAEQSVFHLHFHLLPRMKDDGFHIFPTLPKNEHSMQELCDKLKVKEEEISSRTNSYILYTDGACSGNPGPGGWGAVLMFDDKKVEMSGGEHNTTNNRMELTAVIKGLESIKNPSKVDVYSDSAYVVNAFLQGWVNNWLRNGWKTSKGSVLNIDLWQKLVELTNFHKVEWHKVKGHADNEFNNKCDALATGEIKKL